MATVLISEAQSLQHAGRLTEAAALYHQQLKKTPDDARVLEAYGQLCLEMGQGTEALHALQRASDLAPGNVPYLENLAAAAWRCGVPGLAVARYRAALQRTPGAGALRRSFARLLCQMGRPNAAMTVLEKAVYGDPVLRAQCHNPDREVNPEARQQLVVGNCRHIVARFPDYAPAHYGLACALLVLGEMADAVAAAEAAIRINPTLPVYYHVVLAAGSKAQKAKAVAALEKLKDHAGQMPPDGAAMLHFLLGKAYDKAGHYEAAFAEFAAGNRLKRGLIRYDIAADTAEMEQIAAQFPARMFSAAAPRPGDSPHQGGDLRQGDAPRQGDDLRPVFVVGMLRSGTSLIEQMLASHPEVYGAGEIPLLPEVLAGAGDPARLSEADFAALGARYLAGLRRVAPGAKYVVDKLPENFRRVGWIVRMLPEARILYVRRNALDCCFSCFSQMFAGDVGYAYDQRELGQYYKACAGLMAHWEKVLPPGHMLGLDYEKVVEAPEEEIRRMLDFCALSWDPACLNFHRTRRAVATASLSEVRRPLYRSSVGRANLYRPWLAQLSKTLGQSDAEKKNVR